MKRTIFFISDHTGITAEAIGRSLLSQFKGLEYETIHMPFIDSIDKARRASERINQATMESHTHPLVFSTLVDPKLRACLRGVGAVIFDFFDDYTHQLEKVLGTASTPVRGHAHGMGNHHVYNARIHAVNFALANDDGAVVRNYASADLILLGVSRSGKTPTCLFLGLQHGILAANYPLTDDDLENGRIPKTLQSHTDKLFGLTIDIQQLQRIRQERRPGGRYASLAQCRLEVEEAETMFHRYKIPFLDTTSMSVEEISARVLQQTGLESRMG
ncbi:MAG: kinase/pyrophosphorylase [gamma proteobacterium endosymbiont of Lamellibrachia anaximandri]|nr:kinase/pyrophosphorylase [gamma proteobacterium endosymbiont of Lamellibrachia anaximandri]